MKGGRMIAHRLVRLALVTGLAFGVAACGGGGLFNRDDGATAAERQESRRARAEAQREAIAEATGENDREGSSLFDLFANADDPNTTVEVNKYIWQASLEVMNFLPIESVDPFTGVIVTGFGRPPGGGRAYRATIYVQDPALDARSLKIALQSQGGGSVAPETVRAVEDAILTRARQLRIRDSNL
jgi:hypothetical protein